MRRFIVGLLATVGTLTLLAAGAAVAFVMSAPFATAPLPKSMVLSLDLRSMPGETAASELFGLWQDSPDIIETARALWRAADDPRVSGIFVEVGDDSAGLARVQELRDAFVRLRAKGKFAVGFAEGLGQSGEHFADYYLASALDQIWLQPSGTFAVAGIAVETPFLKQGLDRLGIRAEGGKRQEYKSAPDSFTETGHSAATRQNLQRLLDSLYGRFIEDVARERKIEPARLRQLIDAAPFSAERARSEGLIDRVGYRADAMEAMWQRAGKDRELVALEDYAAEKQDPPGGAPVLALVRVSGAITSGTSSASPLDDESAATSDDVVEAIELASRNRSVKAIVLRIDSPGGTYPAADAIADAVRRARALGKPVVVSMGDVAASGGYLAAVRADAIVAQPTTITGSIGVFGLWPVAADLLTSLGVNVERLQAGANAGFYSMFQSPTPTQRAAIGRDLDAVYADFTRQVGEARNLDAGRLDAAARGRIFSGSDARQAGLVDELGGLQAAIDIAKARANIEPAQAVELRRFPREGARWERLAERLQRMVGVNARGPHLRAPREVREAMARLGIAAHPGNVRLPPLPPLWK